MAKKQLVFGEIRRSKGGIPIVLRTMNSIMKKERPILFSGEMVRAIRKGRKTQTRRVIKPQPELNQKECVSGEWLENIHCPFGNPGDALWVREGWRFKDFSGIGEPLIEYAAGGKEWVEEEDIPENWIDRLEPIWSDMSDMCERDDLRRSAERWRPSIHMPRWASRITLGITNLRIERLNDCDGADARSEGFKGLQDFKNLWDKLNAARGNGWDSNPLVWVVEFICLTNGRQF